MATKKKKIKTQKFSKKTNFNDVLIRLIDVMYDFINSGNLIGVIIFFVMVIIFMLGLKLPSENINQYILKAGAFVSSEKFYMIPLGISLLFSVTTNIFQYKIYKTEIRRLTEHRKNLIHGLDSGKLKELDEHTSSDFDFNQIKKENGICCFLTL